MANSGWKSTLLISRIMFFYPTFNYLVGAHFVESNFCQLLWGNIAGEPLFFSQKNAGFQWVFFRPGIFFQMKEKLASK